MVVIIRINTTYFKKFIFFSVIYDIIIFINMKSVLTFRTTKWDIVISDFVNKLYTECRNVIDFYIIAPNTIFSLIPNDYKQITKFYDEIEIIENLTNYWFYINHGYKYDYIWTIDYNVRILGNSNYFWNCNIDDDLLIVKNIQNNNSYLPLSMFRISKKYLELINNFIINYNENKNNNNDNNDNDTDNHDILQEEKLYGHILDMNKDNLTYDYQFLNKNIQGLWTQNINYVDYNIDILNKIKNSYFKKPSIFCPVQLVNNFYTNANIIKKLNINTNNLDKNIPLIIKQSIYKSNKTNNMTNLSFQKNMDKIKPNIHSNYKNIKIKNVVSKNNANNKITIKKIQIKKI